MWKTIGSRNARTVGHTLSFIHSLSVWFHVSLLFNFYLLTGSAGRDIFQTLFFFFFFNSLLFLHLSLLWIQLPRRLPRRMRYLVLPLSWVHRRLSQLLRRRPFLLVALSSLSAVALVLTDLWLSSPAVVVFRWSRNL